jgi:dTDP-4-amino-4,6-dideoxygalactose transaminase
MPEKIFDLKRSLPINKPLLGIEEQKETKKVLEFGLLSDMSLNGGPMVQRFEKALANFLGVKDVVAVNNGASALHASLLAIDITYGDEVIIPSLTFAATGNAVLLTGARPVFVDIDLKTYNINPEKIEKKITKRTKAIIPVHLYGLPADMDPIMEIAEKYNLTVIEDACQANGSEYKGKKAGSIAHLGCLSFNPIKVMTCGEGGAIATSNEKLAEKLRMIRSQGQIKGYDTAVLGSNFRMPEIEAAIAYVQLKKLPDFLQIRRRNAEILTQLLKGLEELTLPHEPPGFKHNWYVYTVRLNRREESRDRIVQELRTQGIGATVYYPPLHKMPLYVKLNYAKEKLPLTEKASRTVFSLPIHPTMTERDLRYVSDSLKKQLH